MLHRFFTNHVLANLAFVIVMLMGTAAYFQMPREQDPEINFNWTMITTTLPGASAEDVEKLITDPLEEAIAKISDIRFVSSNSREGVSVILVRFTDIDERTFDKRLNDLRREVQNKTNAELPDEAEDPFILEITTSNNIPTAVVLVTGQDDDEQLRARARAIKQDLERLKGVDRVITAGLHDPELLVEFDAQALASHGVPASALANTVGAYFRDISAGDLRVGEEALLARLQGTDSHPDYLAGLPVTGAAGELALGELARVSRGRGTAEQLVRYRGLPAVMLGITKKSHVNTLDLVERINHYLATRIETTRPQGIEVVLLDDQTVATREALGVMQDNAVLGLILVALVTWVFLGSRISLFVGLGIPFSLAGTFWVLELTGNTLNVSVLLGLVMVLGMLVDDAVVVVESIYYRLQRGMDALQASIESLREVAMPVTAAVLTTMAAFLPLMLMPGIVGKFMFVVPFVVTVALAISLIEAFWMLPVHISAARVSFDSPSPIHKYRVKATRWVCHVYTKILLHVMRRPKRSLAGVGAVMLAAALMVAAGTVRVQFFAFDPMQLYYINVEMPPGTPLEKTMDTLLEVEARARRHVREDEVRGIASIAGQMFTKIEQLFGDRYGQIMVSLTPHQPGMRTIDEVMEAMREDVMAVTGPANISFLRMEKGPPTTKPVQVKVRGDSFEAIRQATDELRVFLERNPAIRDISDDDTPGARELRLRLRHDAIRRAGLDPAEVTRAIRMLFDGEVAASMQHQGERVEVRVRAAQSAYEDIEQLMRLPLARPGGGEIPLGEVVEHAVELGKSNIRHYNFRRTITLEADLDKERLDTLGANRMIEQHWEQIGGRYPGVSLDFTGEMEDILESLQSLMVLFPLGICLIYLILGTQFRSYYQPFMILATVPMAFAGVVFGLALSQHPLSLYTMYGVVALAGVAVNSAIVMIDAANQRLAAGMSVLHAIVFASRRRVIPILITSLTTIAGLFSLATGMGGASLMWGPVASAIVWGLGVSTALTLWIVPLVYLIFMRRSHLNRWRGAR